MKLTQLLEAVQEKFQIEKLDVVESDGQTIHLIYPVEDDLEKVHDFIDDASKDEDELDAMDMRSGDINGFAVSDSEIDEKFNPVTIVPQSEEDVDDDEVEDDEDASEEPSELTSEEVDNIVEEILKTESREELKAVLEAKRSRAQARPGQIYYTTDPKTGKPVKHKKGKKLTGSEKMARKRGARKAAKKRRAKKAQIARKTKKTQAKRKWK